MHKIVIKNGPRQDSVYELLTEQITIGRGQDNVIIIPDPAVSRNHAQIVFKGTQCVISDLKSTNGVYVNGKKVATAVLSAHDEIRIGDTLIEFTEERDARESGRSNTVIIETRELDPKRYSIEEIESNNATVLFREYQILSAFYRISKTLTGLSDFRTAIRDALAYVLDIMKAENGFVFIHDDKTGALIPEVALNARTKDETDFSKCSETIIQSVFCTGKSVLSSDAGTDERFKGAQSIVSEHIKSVMCVPIKTSKRTLGVIEVDTRRGAGGFTVDDLEIMGVIAGHIGMFLENARLYDDIRRINEKLVSLDEMKTKFITMVGHELATPITIIDQYVVLLREKLFGEVNEKQHKVLDIVVSRVMRLKKIIADVAKIATGTISYDQLKRSGELFAVNELIEEVARELRPLAEGRHQRMAVSIGITDCFAKANREGTREVLLNLGVNAIKFTPDGGQVSMSLIDGKEHVRIEVKDTGIGIPAKEHDKIFESFYKVEDVKHHHSGTVEFKAGGLGLGLTIARQIVESQNGKMWVESEEGKGSMFCLTLPKR